MKINIKRLTPLMLVTAFSFNQNALATKVFQWVDEEGVVQFSDVPPSDNIATEIQEINFINYAANESDPNEYSIVNQLERMAEWRRQTEEERLARKQLQLEEQRLAKERNSYQFIDNPGNRANYPATFYYSYPGNFGGYNKWHSNQWGGHFGSGHEKHGNSKDSAPQYKLDHYKVGSGF